MVGRSWVPWCIMGLVTGLLVTSCESGKTESREAAGSEGGEASAAASGGPSSDGAGTDGQSVPTAGQGGHGATGGTGPNESAAGTAGDAGIETGGAGGSDPGLPDTTWLGLHCQSDAGCGDRGLYCLGADQDYPGGFGAPARGLCTRECEEDSDCRAFDPHAVCGTLDELPISLGKPSDAARRLCLQGCWFGQPTGVEKCHGQTDMACRPFAPTNPINCDAPNTICPSGTLCFRGYCRGVACGPRCNVDSDCSAGRVCNPATGLCDRAPPPPVPIGAECPGDQDPGSTVCGSGTCLLLFSDGRTLLRMCTQSCTLGQRCGDDGACIMPRLQSSAAGDIAYCAQRCDCDADCRHPGQKCYEWYAPALATRYQSRGFCDVEEAGFETLGSCEGDNTGGAGGVNGGGVGGRSDAGVGGAD